MQSLTPLIITLTVSLYACSGDSNKSVTSNEHIDPNVESTGDQVDASDTQVSDNNQNPVTETTPGADEIEVGESDVVSEENTDIEVVTEVVTSDYTDITPFCADAPQRVFETVEIGMSPEQVKSLVGRPLMMNSYGLIWDYGYEDLNTEVVYFSETLPNRLVPNDVSASRARSIRCTDRHDSFIEASNALAQEAQGPDLTNTTVSCLDAALRIQAFIELGLTQGEVRALLGEPTSITDDAELWLYGSRLFGDHPRVRFETFQSEGVGSPAVVTGYESRYEDCE